MAPLSLILRKINASYELGKKEYKLDHFLITDDLKLFLKWWRTNRYTVRTVHVFGTDIGIEFGMKKCGILTMKRGTVVRCEGIKLPNSEVMKEDEKEFEYS